MSDKGNVDRRLQAQVRRAGELLVRRGSNPDVLVARGRFGQAFIDAAPERTIWKRLRELVDVIRADPEVARVWSRRAVSRIELYAVADAMALGADTIPPREELLSGLRLIPRGGVVRAIRDEDDVRRFRRVIAPGQTWVRWDELAAHQAEVLRGLVDAEWQRVESGLKSPEGRRARIRLIPRPDGGEERPT